MNWNMESLVLPPAPPSGYSQIVEFRPAGTLAGRPSTTISALAPGWETSPQASGCQARSPQDPWNDADLSLWKLTDHQGFCRGRYGLWRGQRGAPHSHPPGQGLHTPESFCAAAGRCQGQGRRSCLAPAPTRPK
ncbi:uncharacterized protein AAEQ78_018766 isoform 2-T5 [Lycaon pictus]